MTKPRGVRATETCGTSTLYNWRQHVALWPVYDISSRIFSDESKFFYGDNLTILREHIASESVDLTYLDPPFKSNQDYPLLFAEQDGTRSAAQVNAFEDTWRWDQAAATAYDEVVEAGGKVSEAMQAFRQLLGESDMQGNYLDHVRPLNDGRPIAMRDDRCAHTFFSAICIAVPSSFLSKNES